MSCSMLCRLVLVYYLVLFGVVVVVDVVVGFYFLLWKSAVRK